MFSYKGFALRKISGVGARYMPFADAASPEVPLSRLLRLSLFQVTVGMALLPFGGFAIMPFALLVLSGFGEAVDAPRWIGLSSAALAFLLVGAGAHIVQTVGLALATDLVPEADQPKVVGLMYVMLLVGMICSAFAYGALLENYSPGRLVQVIQGSAVVTVALNFFVMWKQEARNRARAMAMQVPEPGFAEAWARLTGRPGMVRLLTLIALGTAGFGMADVLLERFGGQVLMMSIAETTRLTVFLASSTLIGFTLAARSDAGAATAYARAMTADQALLVVQVPFNPVGGARGVLKLLRKHPAMAVGVSEEDFYLRDYPTAQFANRVMTNHPLLASNPFRVPSHGHIFGNNPVIHSKDRTSAMRGGAYMSRFFWPMKLVSAPRQRRSAMRGGFLFSSLFGLKLVTGSWPSRDLLPTIRR